MTTPSTPDPTPSAALAGIRERYAHTRAPITGNSVTTLFASASDVPSLVAALEAVLALADEAVPQIYAQGKPLYWSLSPDDLRVATTTALTGTPQPGENEGP